MEKMLALMLMMSLMTVSCSKSGGGSSSEHSTQSSTANPSDNGNTDDGNTDDNGTTTPTTPTTPTPSPNVPSAALTFGANVDLMEFTAEQEDKYNQAIELVKKVVATEAFRTQVLNHTYGGSKTYANNNGKTNEQIYQSILDAAEKLYPTKNNAMDLGVKLYYENSTVVGYTSSNITYINVNTKFFNQYDINEVAGNLFHEWLHKVGYGHDSAATTARPYSVPYAVGYMIRTLGKNFL